MKLGTTKEYDINYLAKIVNIDKFEAHPNPVCEKLKLATVDGFHIAVDINTPEGQYLYFPTECAIDKQYLSANNQLRDSSLNADSTKKGFFDDKGRVRAIKLLGVASEGFIMPLDSLSNWLKVPVEDIKVGTEFNTVNDNILCTKYTVKKHFQKTGTKTRKVKKALIKVDETQFRFHYDTVLIKKCPWVLSPNQLISITYKMHGTSGISSYVLCNKPKTFWQKLLRKAATRYYDYIYASRKVIKDPYYNPKVSNGYYSDDIWEKAHNIIKPFLKQGMTIYYEICGYLPNGGYIQKGFDYGCIPPEEENVFEINKHFKVFVYRITYTGADGEVYEFSARQVQQYCERYGLIPVMQAYYGYAKDLYPELEINNDWPQAFIDKLSKDKQFYMEQYSPHCNNKVPHEGVVIKIENFKSEAFKLKCEKFLLKESKDLDEGIVNIEE